MVEGMIDNPKIERPLIVRSLRRRLWTELQDENIEMAMRAYCASKADYELWLDQEAAAEEAQRKLSQERKKQEKKEKLESRSAVFRRLGSVRAKSKRHIAKEEKRKSANAKSLAEARKVLLMDDDGLTLDPDQPILQTLFHPNDFFERDDYFGVDDNYDPSLLFPLKPSEEKKPVRPQHRKGPRMAGSFFWKSSKSRTPTWDPPTETKDDGPKVDENLTSLLHEVCRLGNVQFLRLLLSIGARPNGKNGKERTALHMIAGGCTRNEAIYRRGLAQDVGIRVPVMQPIVDRPSTDSSPQRPLRKVAGRAMSKVFSRFRDGAPTNNLLHPEEALPVKLGDEDYVIWTTSRMEALISILSWQHPRDGTPEAGDGPSLNSVDIRGRTALHYAAEMGRTDICVAILTSFGAIMTVVDESGQTPCEVAGQQGHEALAAQLEARALLYKDPYGMEDEMMSSVWGPTSPSDSEGENLRDDEKLSSRREIRKLAVPFSSYETWKIDRITQERTERMLGIFTEMQSILRSKQEQKESTEFVMNHGMDDSIDFDENDLGSSLAPLCDKEEESAKKNKATEIEKKQANAENIKPLGSLKADKENEGEGEAEDSTENESAQKGEEKNGGENPNEDTTEMDAADKNVDNEIKGDEPNTQNSTSDGEKEEAQVISLERSLEILDIAARRKNKLPSEYQYLLGMLTESHAERFASFHGWCKSKALKAFRTDPMKAIQDAGIATNFDSVAEAQKEKKEEPEAVLNMCMICCEDSPDKWISLSNCKHGFCTDCLGDYVGECARAKMAGFLIECPHHECNKLLTSAELERLSQSKDNYNTIVESSNENFIASAEDFCFCPHKGCNGVIRRRMHKKLLGDMSTSSKLDTELVNCVGAVCVATGHQSGATAPLTYEGVRDPNYTSATAGQQPIKAHRFCFQCKSPSIHWPISCDMLEKWKAKITEEIGELETDGETGEEDFNEVAQKLWIKANTRPCPKCKAPIEKNDGCNHMICSNRLCRHEFCWICREDWKLHNTETGGFFRCNRWQGDENHDFYDTPPPPEKRARASSAENVTDVLPSEHNYGTALHSSRVAWKKSKEMDRFLHHYRRWTAHSESAMLERKMANSVCERLSGVVKAAIEFNNNATFNFGGLGLSFVHNAFYELLECRSLLQHSYVFAFYRYPHKSRRRLKEKEKALFERAQSEVEMLTEQLSDIVARKHLRATQVQIMFLTSGAAQKRWELSTHMLRWLHDHCKDEKEEAERAKEGKKPRSRSFGDLPSPFQLLLPTRRDHLPTPIHRHLDGLNRTREYDSEDDDFMLMNGALRLDQGNPDLQDALRSSAEAFVPQFHDLFDGEMDRFQDWSCAVCTYMNAGGRRCAMCGTSMRR